MVRYACTAVSVKLMMASNAMEGFSGSGVRHGTVIRISHTDVLH